MGESMITAMLCIGIIGWCIYGIGLFLAIAIIAGILLGLMFIYKVLSAI
jgi:hypothetical protein